jgi:hypothetical protein
VDFDRFSTQSICRELLHPIALHATYVPIDFAAPFPYTPGSLTARLLAAFCFAASGGGAERKPAGPQLQKSRPRGQAA